MIDFLVIGAQKCATSWLYYCLQDHPQLHLPTHKKEHEYIGGELYRKRGIEWYRELLEGAKKGQLSGDVSVEYLINSKSPELIKQFSRKTKFIVSIRNPIQRARSAFFWYQRKDSINLNITLEEGLRHGLNLYTQNNHDNKKLSQQDELLKDVIKRGFYYEDLNNYRNFFSDDNFFIQFFGDVQEKPIHSIQKVYSFLGINDQFIPSKIKVKPKKNSYNKFLIQIEKFGANSKIISVITNKMHQLLVNFGNASKTPNLSSDLEIKLFELYKPSIYKLKSFLADLENRQLSSLNRIKNLWEIDTH